MVADPEKEVSPFLDANARKSSIVSTSHQGGRRWTRRPEFLRITRVRVKTSGALQEIPAKASGRNVSLLNTIR
jgi:hypothetical protein